MVFHRIAGLLLASLAHRHADPTHQRRRREQHHRNPEDQLSLGGGVVMHNFKSKSLKRTFKKIIFSQGPVAAGGMCPDEAAAPSAPGAAAPAKSSAKPLAHGAAAALRAGLDHAKQHGLAYRDLTFDPPLNSEQVWQVREVKQLFAGRTAIIGRGEDIAMVPIKAGKEIGIGDHVGVKMLERNGARSLELIAPKQLAKELELSRGLGLGLGR